MYVGNALAVAVSLLMVANATNEISSASTARADALNILFVNICVILL